jgi:hypothetical protein
MMKALLVFSPVESFFCYSVETLSQMGGLVEDGQGANWAVPPESGRTQGSIVSFARETVYSGQSRSLSDLRSINLGEDNCFRQADPEKIASTKLFRIAQEERRHRGIDSG